MNIQKAVETNKDYIKNLRRWFHKNPEISLKEEQTSKKIQKELKEMNIPFEVINPNLGVVASIVGDKTGKIFVIRADIDALPVKEETNLSFKSKNEGVMHACGHDAHIAMALGAAKILNENKDKIKGTIKIIFQAGEEIGEGANEIVDYLKKTGGADQVIGLHIWSDIPCGEILLKPEGVFAGCTDVYYNIIGSGGHGARPDLVTDPIKAACNMVLELASIPSNYYDVLDNAVVTVGKIEAGTKANIFPNEAKIYGTYRYFKPEGKEKLDKQVQRVINGIQALHQVKIESMSDFSIAPIYNQPDMILKAQNIVKEKMQGRLEVSKQTEAISASDNFGVILSEYKGFYGILGGGKENEKNYPQHHPQFDIDEKALEKGVEFFVRVSLDFYENE